MGRGMCSFRCSAFEATCQQGRAGPLPATQTVLHSGRFIYEAQAVRIALSPRLDSLSSTSLVVFVRLGVVSRPFSLIGKVAAEHTARMGRILAPKLWSYPLRNQASYPSQVVRVRWCPTMDS